MTLYGQKIRLLNALATSSEKILNILKKGFIHLSLDKKERKELRAGLDKFIKAISFIISFYYSSLLIWPIAIINLFLILSSLAY